MVPPNDIIAAILLAEAAVVVIASYAIYSIVRIARTRGSVTDEESSYSSVEIVEEVVEERRRVVEEKLMAKEESARKKGHDGPPRRPMAGSRLAVPQVVNVRPAGAGPEQGTPRDFRRPR
ncbi:hypothetical protein BX600DRAFT_438321 [Xylariales sp. PMI_506]|nr:hypothetical protein BX600DRAFT_438321 [Xylariales sp. PMI_506]